MKILMIGPDQHNATDGVIVQGIRYLLSRIYFNYEEDYVELEDHFQQDLNDFNPKESYDLIVVCGTPWLWDSFQKSYKYKNLLNCFDYHWEARILFMGAGSCLALKDINSDILKRPEEIEGIQNLFGLGTVITRDYLARDLLANAGIPAICLPCPAYYCYGEGASLLIPPPHNPILIWTDPTKTISAIDWKDHKKLSDYCQKALKFYLNYNPTIYCTNADDKPMAETIGLPEPILLTSWTETLPIMRTATKVLSGRVHCAVPARAQGVCTEIMPIDTRSHVITDFEHVVNFDPYKLVYDRILKRIL